MSFSAQPRDNVKPFPAGKRIGWLWARLKECEDLPHSYTFERGNAGDITIGHRGHVMGLWREANRERYKLLVEVRTHPTLAVFVQKRAGTWVEPWKVFGTASDCIFSGSMLRDSRSDKHTSHDEATNHRP